MCNLHFIPKKRLTFVNLLILFQLDGYIARNFKNQMSVLGSFIDPLADKLLVSVLTISLSTVGLIPGIKLFKLAVTLFLHIVKLFILAKAGDIKTHLSVCRLISSEVYYMIEHWYLACMCLVTSPFNWHHAVTLTFDIYQGQIYCKAGNHNSPNLQTFLCGLGLAEQIIGNAFSGVCVSVSQSNFSVETLLN